jgi:hypothetical protein
MRYCPVIAVLLGLFATRLDAQALDIGGIELRLGQNVAEGLRALSSYQVRYTEDAQLWLVTQRGESPYQLLGTVAATDGKISTIEKSYWLSTQYDTRRVYTQASREVHRRGGTACDTREVAFTDDQIHKLETRCGLYRLSYMFPSTYQAENIGGGITIRVSTK